jgi:cytochrome c
MAGQSVRGGGVIVRNVRLAAGFVIALSAGFAAAQTPPVGDEAAGEATYTAVCRTCHGGMVAPTLRGVAGRPVASIADFAGYSPALKAKSDQSWTDANLDAFIRAPSEFAPGVLMTASVPDDQARADVIAFIKSLPPPR